MINEAVNGNYTPLVVEGIVLGASNLVSGVAEAVRAGRRKKREENEKDTGR